MDEATFLIQPATQDDLADVLAFLTPFMDRQLLLERTSLELQLLLRHSFKAVDVRSDKAEPMIGFCALEIYSKKLAEIQCLAVCETFRRQGVGKALVNLCVQRARDEKVLELMAISNSEEMFRACGFDYSLPNQKRAFFFQP
ncbi:MAG: GNAT family N-acetyltransferase [Planctomycetota bacterium]